MSREIRRVPLDFDAPLNKVWSGYRTPARFREDDCGDCDHTGYSAYAKHLHDQWYGKVPFDPRDTGSTPLHASTPAVWAFAERNVENAPWYYGTGPLAVLQEAKRLADLFNGAWMHHLSQQDVDALVENERLVDFTHTFSRETRWQKIEPPVHPTAAQVNEWSISGGLGGHGSINAMYVIRARCKRAGKQETCPTCNGHGSVEAYEGQRTEDVAWTRTEPPTGEGWQVWETVSEGSPISPVFHSRGDLIDHLVSPAYRDGQMTPAQAERFVDEEWAPTAVGDGVGIVPGELRPMNWGE